MINPITSSAGIDPVKPVYPERSENRSRSVETSESETALSTSDTLEISASETVKPASEVPDSDQSEATPEEQRFTGESWYRYGFPLAHEVFNS
ncbi:hypothetical protein ISS30_07500 [bacterium]|nr:hypothetical protein [FCB group bacterium]MBL7191526.1 hypothetical protein [bacterium]